MDISFRCDHLHCVEWLEEKIERKRFNSSQVRMPLLATFQIESGLYLPALEQIVFRDAEIGVQVVAKLVDKSVLNEHFSTTVWSGN